MQNPFPDRTRTARRRLLTLVICHLSLTCLLACDAVETRRLPDARKLLASDGEAGDYFGYALATDGKHAVVGAYGDDDRGLNAGAAYVFASESGRWTRSAKLLPLQAVPNEQIGMAVSVSSDFIWVGSRGDIETGRQTGSAYVYRKMEDGWLQVARFRSHEGEVDDQYGVSLSVHGNWAAVGAHGDATRGRDAGCVYVYRRTGEIWQFSERLFAPRGKEADYFGFSIDIVDDRMIVGAFGDDQEGIRAGAAYVYRLADGKWEPETKLVAPDAGRHTLFGHSVALSDRVALVGAHGSRPDGKFSGAAYLFARSQQGWRLAEKLEAPDGGANKYFGFSVDVSPRRILIGARGNSHDGALQAGAAYLFSRSGSEVGVRYKLLAQNPEELDFLGRSVAVTDAAGLVGAHGDDDSGSLSGSVYTF